MLIVIKKDSGEFFSAFSHIRELTDLQERKYISRKSEKTNTGLMNTFKKVDSTKAESQNTETSMEVVEFSLVELFKRRDSPCLGWFRYMLTPLFKIE